jgi:hypothetical protein
MFDLNNSRIKIYVEAPASTQLSDVRRSPIPAVFDTLCTALDTSIALRTLMGVAAAACAVLSDACRASWIVLFAVDLEVVDKDLEQALYKLRKLTLQDHLHTIDDWGVRDVGWARCRMGSSASAKLGDVRVSHRLVDVKRYCQRLRSFNGDELCIQVAAP